METQTDQTKTLKDKVIEHIQLSKQKEKRAWIINVCIVAAIIILWMFVHHRMVENYGDNLRDTARFIMASSVESEEMLDEYEYEWADAIDNGSDFNAALELQYNEFDVDGDIENVQDKQDQIKEMMKDLRDPPEKYAEAHQYLLEQYASYQSYSRLAISPEGSLLSFREKTQELNDNIKESFDKVTSYADLSN